MALLRLGGGGGVTVNPTGSSPPGPLGGRSRGRQTDRQTGRPADRQARQRGTQPKSKVMEASERAREGSSGEQASKKKVRVTSCLRSEDCEVCKLQSLMDLFST